MSGDPLSIGLMVASSLMQGVAEQDALDAGAAADLENARRAELGGALEEEAVRRRERAVSGEAIAALAGNGVAIGTGSALDLVRQNAIEREYDVLNRRYAAGSEAASLRTAAAQKKEAGRFALFGGVLRAGAAALTGIGEARNGAAIAEAEARRRAAQLPGGQQLPVPNSLSGW
ncbi:MAG TPA: hypothetical protein VGW34_03825 [Allosphingosinicella sp.]|nr:hypothetical protein [Allosphingosinicella sp.]